MQWDTSTAKSLDFFKPRNKLPPDFKFIFARNFMYLLFKSSLLVTAVFMLSACSPTISDKSKADLEKPVDCSTAQADLQILEEEKASVGKRMLSGVRSILPVAAVAGLLRQDYGNRVEVATGTYNSDLETKIQEIKSTCHL